MYVRNGFLGITVLVLRRQTFFPAYIFGGCRESCPSTAFFPPNNIPPHPIHCHESGRKPSSRGKKEDISTAHRQFYGSFWGERCIERRRISLTTTNEAPGYNLSIFSSLFLFPSVFPFFYDADFLVLRSGGGGMEACTPPPPPPPTEADSKLLPPLFRLFIPPPPPPHFQALPLLLLPLLPYPYRSGTAGKKRAQAPIDMLWGGSVLL